MNDNKVLLREVDILSQQVQDLQARLDEAQETLQAIRKGEVDAIVASGPEGDQVYTLKGAEEPYRVMVQEMAEGACTLTRDGLILFCNEQLAGILQHPLERVIGSRLQDFISPEDLDHATGLLSGKGRRTAESRLKTGSATFVPVYLSFDRLLVDGTECLSLIVTDLTQQKRTEAIVAEEKFARSVLDQAGEAILVVDPDGTIIRASRTADSLAGVSVLGLKFDEVFQIRLQDGAEWRFAEIGEKAGRRDMVKGVEGSALNTRGETLAVRLAAASLANAGGIELGFVITLTDFTALRATEEALRRSEEARKIDEAVQVERQRLNAVLDMLPVMVCLLSPDHQVRFANRRFREFFGEANGKLCFDHVAGLSAPCPQCQAFRPLETNAPHRWEFAGSDGVFLDVYNLPFTDVDGSPLILVVDVDITERKRAEAALRESEERFRHLADTASAMIWVSGLDKRGTFFNRSWLNFTGRSLAEEMRDGWAATIHPEDRARCQAVYDEAFEARSPYQIEYRRQSKDGGYRWVRSDGVPRFGPVGLFAGYIGSCLDVTEAKRTHEETLARQKLETVGVLAAGVAHDFNNLLGGILANSELAMTELPDGSPAREELEHINTISHRASEIVRQLMAYAGNETPVFEPVDMSALVVEMLELLKLSISKRATINAELPAGLPAVRANAGQIRQVVMNMVTNASEALGTEGGVIKVVTSRMHSSRQPVEGEDNPEQADFIRLEVSDTGCGMTNEVLGKIFDPFFSTKFAGRGLGLAAAQGIIRGHGGKINVNSARGEGTRFEILLPCVGETGRAVAKPGKDESRSVASHTRATVLIVEDEDPLRTAVAKVLRNGEFSVIEAADGVAGIEAFTANVGEIDVVLLDMTLPGSSGANVLLELRRIRPDVKVIVTTAYSQDTVVNAVGKGDPAGFIRKPYRLAELVALIKDACIGCSGDLVS